MQAIASDQSLCASPSLLCELTSGGSGKQGSFMVRLPAKPVFASLALMSVFAAGCNSTRFTEVMQASAPRKAIEEGAVVRATLLTPVEARADDAPARLSVGQATESQVAELSVEVLVADVLTRNPSLAQMVAAWQAASARYPQARSLEDPMLSTMLAPASFGSNSVETGYRVEVSQKIPFPGKLRLRGQAALAEASAAQSDIDDMRVQLIESAKQAFYEYYLVERAISVNGEAIRLLGEFKQSAESRYKTGLVPQQDILQAEVEIGRQHERAVTLERMRKVAVARINTLRSLPPDEPLAPPPQTLKVPPGLPTAATLRSLAVTQRPDLKALQDRITVEETALRLALREYYPDVEVAAAYDTIMGNGPMRDLAPQVGVRMNLPVRLARRHAAVAEAQAKVSQKQAEYTSRVNQIHFQVQEAYEQLVESERVLGLYEKSILPAAQENVKAAQAAYITGKTPFLSLIEAQRNLVSLRDRNYEATADYFRRLATLERATGGALDAARIEPVIQK
jgi:outer membrane protein TolC